MSAVLTDGVGGEPMFDPMLDSRVVEQRKQDLLRQARLHHLRRELLGKPSLLHRRWLVLVADMLIQSGERLKHRCDQARAQAAAAHPDTAVMDMDWERL